VSAHPVVVQNAQEIGGFGDWRVRPLTNAPGEFREVCDRIVTTPPPFSAVGSLARSTSANVASRAAPAKPCWSPISARVSCAGPRLKWLALILHGVVWGCGSGLISVSGRVP